MTRLGVIADLLRQGRRVSEVIGYGPVGGWSRGDVVDVLVQCGWLLDSDGRIPAAARTQMIPPGTPLPGQSTPPRPRRPAVSYPRHR